MSELKFAVIGECMVELSGQPFTNMRQNFGGDTINTAIYLKMLAKEKIDVSFVSSVGDDSLSKALMDKWQQLGINTSTVLINSNKQPGLYMIETDNYGERTFHYWRNDSAAKYLMQHADINVIFEKLSSYDAVYLSGISLAILSDQDCQLMLSQLKQLKKLGVKIIYDSNYRPALWQSVEYSKRISNDILALSDLALFTFDDEKALWQDDSIESCRIRLQLTGVNELVLKDGANGCQYSNTHTLVNYPTTPVVKVIDTTAAGDSFNAGFLALWLQSAPINQCAMAGNLVAGQVIQQKGAIVDINLNYIFEQLSLTSL